jgi:Rrf2 family protein
VHKKQVYNKSYQKDRVYFYMQLSTRTRYGLQAMVQLAASKGVQSLSALAAGQGISEAYLEQLFRSLKQAGLVVSVRGAGGGYTLALPASGISALQIVNALEGNSAVSECVSGGGEPCQKACICAARPLFLELQAKINSVLDGTTLAELTEKYNTNLNLKAQ